MRFLLCLNDVLCKSEPSQEEMLEDILDVLSDEYNRASRDQEAYLCTDSITADDVVFGKDNPDTLVETASEWNERIAQELIQAVTVFVNKATGSSDISKLCASNLKLDTQDTYRLKKAITAADNSWYDFADNMTYLDNSQGYAYFKPLLTDTDLAEIRAHPELYAVVDIHAK